ncbi:MAG: spermidine synthase [Verrucomicrobiales bacterium]
MTNQGLNPNRNLTDLAALIPTIKLAETRMPDGTLYALHEHDGVYSIRFNGEPLMSSSWTNSELILADEGCRFQKPIKAPRVLIGGLGLGFSLRRVLELVGPKAKVCVAELLPEAIAWNREFLGHINGQLLDEDRVEVFTGDVFDCIRQRGPSHFNSILLDTDNGPSALVQPGNSRLYDPRGLTMIYDSLKPGGRVSFWASDPEPKFPKELRKAGFEVEELPAKAYESAKRFAHRIYTGAKRGN